MLIAEYELFSDRKDYSYLMSPYRMPSLPKFMDKLNSKVNHNPAKFVWISVLIFCIGVNAAGYWGNKMLGTVVGPCQESAKLLRFAGDGLSCHHQAVLEVEAAPEAHGTLLRCHCLTK